MLNTTLRYLSCPRRRQGKIQCRGSLFLHSRVTSEPSAVQDHKEGVFEVVSGTLECQKCQSRFPILAGVALLVDRVRDYLLEHVKGISQVVSDSEIPKEYLQDFLEAKSEIQVEHIEEDLEAERIVALYVTNHYLKADAGAFGQPWWKSSTGQGSPLIDRLIRQYWDHGPFAQIETWVRKESHENPKSVNAIELGCGVGGLFSVLKSQLRSYLGVDTSFGSIAVARHLALGVPYSGSLRIPEDLLQGPVSREISLSPASGFDGTADWIVGDLESLPLSQGHWNLAIALNIIDMMDDPTLLPRLQLGLLQEKGVAIQSCPYIWHPQVAQELRRKLPAKLRGSSADAVEWLYSQAGFTVEQRVFDIPWLFFKHIRQLEIYSVHALMARK